MNNQHQAQQSQWVITIYFILSIYYFGMVAATYAITYPGFGYVHEHFQAYMAVLNGKMDFWLGIPAVLLAISALSLLRWSPGSFPRWSIWVSVGLVLISVSTTFFAVLLVLHAMPLAGFDPETHRHLRVNSMFFQVIPSGIQCLTGVWLLNRYLKMVRPVSRWFFILLFLSAFYTLGTNTVESLIEYPLWQTIGETDWHSYRQSVSFTAFIWMYLIPGWLPLLLMIPMIWLRPKGVPIVLPVLYAIGMVWGIYITATYFVPDIQLQLDKAYSPSLIADLLKNDMPMRGFLMYVNGVIMIWTFFKIDKYIIDKTA